MSWHHVFTMARVLNIPKVAIKEKASNSESIIEVATFRTLQYSGIEQVRPKNPEKKTVRFFFYLGSDRLLTADLILVYKSQLDIEPKFDGLNWVFRGVTCIQDLFLIHENKFTNGNVIFLFFKDNYTFAQPGIQMKVNALRELIQRIDGERGCDLVFYCFIILFILVPMALSFLLAGWALAGENKGLWGHRISSPRF